MPGTAMVAELETHGCELPTLSKWDLRSAALFSAAAPRDSARAVWLQTATYTQDTHPWQYFQPVLHFSLESTPGAALV